MLSAKSQSIIPGVAVIHTNKNSGFFKIICFKRECVNKIVRDKERRKKKNKFSTKGIKKKNEKATVKKSKTEQNRHTHENVEALNDRKPINSTRQQQPNPSSMNDTIKIAHKTLITIDSNQANIREILVNKITLFEWVYFESDKWNLNKAGEFELLNLYSFLESHHKLKVRIMAHTDSDGSNNSNMILSENRAKAVVEFLISIGLPERRINWKF